MADPLEQYLNYLEEERHQLVLEIIRLEYNGLSGTPHYWKCMGAYEVYKEQSRIVSNEIDMRARIGN